MKYSVIIPVFSDPSALPELLLRLFRMADSRKDDVELIVVDDGSAEESWQRIRAAVDGYPDRRVTLIRLAHNHGQQPATICGLLHATSDLLVTLDADLQHPPEAIPLLLDVLVRDRLELVYGAGAAGHGPGRRILSAGYRGLASLVGSAFFHAASFRAMRRSLVERLKLRVTERIYGIDDCLRELVREAGHVAIPHQERRYGRSGYTWSRLLNSIVQSGYHSRQLRPVALRVAVAMLLLAATNLVLAGRLLPWGVLIVLVGLSLLLLAVGHWITERRQRILLADQFAVREIVGNREMYESSRG